jgi:hypothetical protein
MSSALGLARRVTVVSTITALVGCSTVTRLEGSTPGTALAIKGMDRTELPRTEDLASKATGQYEFMATTPDGKKLYGILPLSVNGGTIVLSILFFAPALFIAGFRDTFPFYQVDPENNVIRYKVKEADEWKQYQPPVAEGARSKASFDTLK